MLLLVDVKKRFMLRSEKWLTGPNIRKEHRAGPMEGGGKGGGTGGAYELAVLPSWSPYGAYALGCAGGQCWLPFALMPTRATLVLPHIPAQSSD